MIKHALLLPATLVASLAAAAPSAAQTVHLEDAWAAALAEREPVLDERELARVNVIAYHSAVARLCEGFEVNTRKIATATNEIVAAGTEELEEEDLMARQADILVMLGTAHGLFLAEGSLNRDQFCDEAAETRADPEFANYWQ